MQFSKTSNIVHIRRMNIANILVPVSVKIIFFFIHIDQSLICHDDIIIIVQNDHLLIIVKTLILPEIDQLFCFKYCLTINVRDRLLYV